MALFSLYTEVLLTLLLCFVCRGVNAATFTLVNQCDFTVWPGILASADSSKLDSTGFELPKGDSRSFPAPAGWGRTGCNFDDQGHGSCLVGDCGSGQVECNGAGAVPPATLAEFTIGSGISQDFYDGYNLPVIVHTTGGSGNCATTGCATDVNRRCPEELRAAGGAACKSACDAFGTPEYCCRIARHVQAVRVLAAIQGGLPQILQLRLRRPFEHFYLFRC